MNNKVCVCGVDTSSIPKISSKEMLAIISSIKKGDNTARDKCIYYNMRLVLSIVQRFSLRQENIDDVFQVGMIGLIKAIDNFDLSIGVQFSTYAVPMIIGEIRRFQRDRTSIKVTRSMRDIAYKALQAKEFLSKTLPNEPTIEDIARHINSTVNEVKNCLDSTLEPISIYDTIYSNNGECLELFEQLKDEQTSEDIWLEKTVLSDSIKKLDEREREIVFLRYYFGKTQTEVSNEIGISQAQVSRLEKNALLEIKKML